MKRISKGLEPDKLAIYSQLRPGNTWGQFSKNKNRKKQVQSALLRDQGGICAYCEIDLAPADSTGVADLRVEHFHPKSDTSIQHNWHLDWQNLFACCHGGSRSDVVDAATRFTSPDNSCDVPKADDILTEIILNPLNIPAFPPIFKCTRTSGELSVDVIACNTANLNVVSAENTIKYLNLRAPRLNRLRKAELDELNLLLRKMVADGVELEVARAKAARAILLKDANNHWPKFFSSIRYYLGAAAEKHLQSTSYSG